MKTKHWLVIIAAVTVIGFFVGRLTVKHKETIRYVKDDTVHGEYPSHLLKPIKIEVPDHPNLPYYFFTERVIERDSVTYIVMEIDLDAVYKDYITRKTYDLTLFNNNKQGDLKGTATVQYNSLQSFNYAHTPISKEVTIISKPVWTPFVAGGLNSFNMVSAGGGIIYHNIGIEGELLYDYKRNKAGYGGRVVVTF